MSKQARKGATKALTDPPGMLSRHWASVASSYKGNRQRRCKLTRILPTHRHRQAVDGAHSVRQKPLSRHDQKACKNPAPRAFLCVEGKTVALFDFGEYQNARSGVFAHGVS